MLILKRNQYCKLPAIFILSLLKFTPWKITRSVIHKNKSSVNLSLHKPQSSINVECNLLDKTLLLLANVESKYSRLTPEFFRSILWEPLLSRVISSLWPRYPFLFSWNMKSISFLRRLNFHLQIQKENLITSLQERRTNLCVGECIPSALKAVFSSESTPGFSPDSPSTEIFHTLGQRQRSTHVELL